MKTFIKQVIAVIALVALIAAPFSPTAPGMAETNANGHPHEIWDGSIAEGFANGSGTEDDPYLISNGAELAYLAQQTNSGVSYEGSCFTLTNDIHLNDTTDWESWVDDSAPTNEWTAIGTGSDPFSGCFDGNEYAVYGAYINRPGSYYQGLFGYAEDSVIANLGVSESYIFGGYYVGGVVGENHGTVDNCYNAGSVTGTCCQYCGIYVGGVVSDNYGTVSNCYNAGSVNGGGGVVGENYGTVDNCYNTGSVTGLSYVGGVVGYNSDTVSNCYNTGCITGSNDDVGGVVGENDDTVINCYNTGSVTGYHYWTGGVIGENYGTAFSCYNTGSVTGSEYVGGVVGANNCIVLNCYYLDTSCESGDEYAVALTDEQMREVDSFNGFDFGEVWTMEGNASYPYPELISNPHMGLAMPGDLDGDGVITVVDANAALRIALELEDFNPIGDVDSDGAVTLADANAILRWAIGL